MTNQVLPERPEVAAELMRVIKLTEALLDEIIPAWNGPPRRAVTMLGRVVAMYHREPFWWIQLNEWAAFSFWSTRDKTGPLIHINTYWKGPQSWSRTAPKTGRACSMRPLLQTPDDAIRRQILKFITQLEADEGLRIRPAT